MRDLSVRSALTARIRQWLSGRARGDRGAIGVLVAVFLAAGVLFGMGAMVIDVGRLYQNRAELQNGADAAALAVAQSCAAGNCTETSAQTTAQTYANENASALTSSTAGVVTPVCGSSGSGLTTCAAKPNYCPVSPTDGSNFVDVVTHTKVPSGTLLPPIFAQTLVSGYQGTEQFICAQATWGLKAGIGFTVCSPFEASSPQLAYPFTTVPVADDTILSMSNGSCGGSAGNFGWTDSCPVLIPSGNQYGGNTGASPKGPCGPQIAQAWTDANAAKTSGNWDSAIVFIPLYSLAQNPGSNATYTLDKFIGFVVTSYQIPSVGSKSDWLDPSGGCSSNKCISGFFVNKTLPASAAGARLIG
jgi:Flp pilus assembly protein TadG